MLNWCTMKEREIYVKRNTYLLIFQPNHTDATFLRYQLRVLIDTALKSKLDWILNKNAMYTWAYPSKNTQLISSLSCLEVHPCFSS